jgi:hypothetical protein
MDKPQEIRRAAAAAGQKRYYTGQACRQGHLAERFVSNGACIECMRPTIAAPDAASGKVVVPVGLVLSTRMAQNLDVVNLAKERLLAQWPEAWAWAEKEHKRRSQYVVKPGSGATLAPTAKCEGRTLDEFRASGWTDGQLVYEGFATIVPAGTE